MSGWRLFVFISGIAILWILYYPITAGYDQESLGAMIRLTARMAGVLFALSFVASAFQYFFKGVVSFWLLANRRYIGLSFALIHTIHLFLIFLLQLHFRPIFQEAAPIAIVGGAIAYLLMILMSITSFEPMRSRLTRGQWRLLHTVGGYWIWLIFLLTYQKRDLSQYDFKAFFIFFIIILVLRILHLLSKQKKKLKTA